MKRYILGFALFIATIMLVNGCGSGAGKVREKDAFNNVYKETISKNGIREISYGQFLRIRNSGEEYVLFDVLSADSYKRGHIKDARSFPVNTITLEAAKKKITNGSGVVVYCSSHSCGASTKAAQQLSALGYKILDYKGGLMEWQENGNRLVR